MSRQNPGRDGKRPHKTVASGRGRRRELANKRAAKREKREVKRRTAVVVRGLPVDEAKLAPHNSYSQPTFVKCGYYEDQPFECVDCGASEVWTASQQKWWYEVVKGDPFTVARRCRACRRRERVRREEARRIHLEGIARQRRREP